MGRLIDESVTVEEDRTEIGGGFEKVDTIRGNSVAGEKRGAIFGLEE